MPMPVRPAFGLVLGLALALAITGRLAAADAAMYWGGTIKGATYGETGDAPGDAAVLEAFERHAGKKVTFINTGQQWASFDRGTMQKVIEAGALPLVTMGLQSGVTLAEVAEGKQDAQIAAWARAAKEWGYPFLFRPWWEVNGDWYAWGRSPDFIAAWQHFHDIVVREGATNVTWAWVVNSIWWDPLSDPTPYYPGDEYVDWVGMDTYNWGLNPLQPDRWLTPQQAIEPTLEVLERIAPGKPVCICEDASTEIGGDKPSWIREMLATYLPDHPSIKAYLWFNWNVAQGSGNWDWPIESSTASEQAFRDAIQSSIYLSRLPELTKLEKVPVPPRSGLPESLGPAPPSSLPRNGDWSGTLETTEPGQDAREPQVSIGPDGSGTLVWDQWEGANYLVQSRRVGPGGFSMGPVETLSLPGQDAFRPQVSVGVDGTATVAWVQYEGRASSIYERRIGPEGIPESQSHRLSATGQSANQVQLASSPDGGAVVVWERYSGYRTQVQSSIVSPAGAPAATPANLSDGAQNAVEPHVVVEPDDSSIVIWTRYDGSDQVVQGRRTEPTGAPDATTFDLSESGENAIEPVLAMGPDGSATAAWIRSDGTEEVAQSLRLLPSGAPGGIVETLSGAGEDAVAPAVAVAPSGDASVVWQRSDGSTFVIQGRHLDPDGSPDAPVYTVSEPGADAREPEIAVGADGLGMIAWSRFDGAEEIVEAERLEPSGLPVGSPSRLSAPGEEAGTPVVAAGPKGSALVGWRRFDGSFDRVQAAGFGKPEVDVSPSGHDFGEVATGASVPAAARFRVGNEGTAPLAVTSLVLGGPDPGQFALDDGGCSSATIPPGGGCVVEVAFAPTASGVHVARLQVLTANGGEDFAELSGTGSEAPPEQVAEPSGSRPADPPPGDPVVAELPSNQFVIGKPRLDLRDGTALLPLWLPEAGTVSLGGKDVVLLRPETRAHTLIARGPERMFLRLRAKGPKLRRLDRSGRAKVRATVTFMPAGGRPLTKEDRIVLRRRRDKHER